MLNRSLQIANLSLLVALLCLTAAAQTIIGKVVAIADGDRKRKANKL